MKLNMKKLRYLTGCCIACFAAALCTASLPSCSDDYDDTDIKKEIQDVKDRVAKLEEWQKTVNSDITSIKGLVEALQQKNFITDVTPITEGGEEIGYTITFQTGKSITIKNGVNGKTPIIGVAKEGDIYYWTIKTGDADAVFMTDAEGNKMPVTGPKGDNGADAVAPQVRINAESNEWELSTDGGETWTGTGVKATGANGENGEKGEKGEKGDKGDKGDAIFAENGIDTESDPDNVIFTLADGTTLTIPKAKELAVAFDSFDSFTVALTGENEIAIVLPSTLKESDFTALVAEVKSETGTGMDIYTKADPSAWSVKITEPTFTDGKYNNDAKVRVKMPTDAKNGEKAVLKITLITGNGQEISASRILVCEKTAEVDVTAGGLEVALNGVDPEKIVNLSIAGSLNDIDFEYIRTKLSALERLDLSQSSITELPEGAFAFITITKAAQNENTTLKEVILPEGLITMGDNVFAGCVALEKVNIPSTVTQLGDYLFYWCKSVKSVIIPKGVSEIPEGCFYGAGLTSIDIPETVKIIGDNAFDSCPLIEVTIPKSVISIGANAFGCSLYSKDHSLSQLRTIRIEANITEIPEFCFGFQMKLSTIILPDSITKIGRSAFILCPMTSIELPKSLEIIEDCAFCGNNLTSITIPDKVTTIGRDAFFGHKIPVIDLPASIRSLHARAFYWGCAKTVICRAITIPDMPLYGAIEGSTIEPFEGGYCILKVPAESIDEYKAAWGSYFSKIEAIEE